MQARWLQHLSHLRRGMHCNPLMQKVFNRYGEAAFTVSCLRRAHPGALQDLEQWWLNLMCDFPGCMNAARDSTAPRRGIPLSEAAKAKLREARSGRALSAEHRAAISIGGRGLKRSNETRRRIGAANFGERNSMYGKVGAQNAKSRAVRGRCVSSGAVLDFDSMTLAEGAGFRQECISRVCAGRSRSHLGYTWEMR